MKLNKLALVLLFIAISMPLLSKASRGGGYDFEDGKPAKKINVSVLQEAIQAASLEDSCNVELVVRAIGAALFDSPGKPADEIESLELSANEEKCWKRGLARVEEIRKALENTFTSTKKE